MSAPHTLASCAWALVLVLLSLSPAPVLGQIAGPSTAFFYGAAVPVDLLGHFERVVVRPEHLAAAARATLEGAGTQVFAYLKAGEVERRMALLWEEGYRGFYLEGLEGEIEVIRAMHRRFPGIRILLHEGPGLLPELRGLIVGIVAGPLFQGFSPGPGEGRYFTVSEEERRQRLGRLLLLRDRYRVPVTVIDHVPPAERDLMRATAQRIATSGLSPWVTDAAFETLGVGAVEVVPRRILALYDSHDQKDPNEAPDVAYCEIHRIAAMVMEYLGYAVDYQDVRAPLPEHLLTGRYAGIVSWFGGDDLPRSLGYRTWLLRQLGAGVKVAILGHLGFDADTPFLRRLGLSRGEEAASGPVRIRAADELLGFESPPVPRQSAFAPFTVEGQGVKRHLSLEDEAGRRMDPVFTAPWGGMALDPYLLHKGAGESQRWIVNPFEFLRLALHLPPIPAPDVTTEQGRRLLIVHIDGDAFVSRAEMPGTEFAGKVILDRILKVYRVPTTVSVIEGEVGPAGKYPQLSPQLEAIAREIFRLPHVELATHTYSHPFDWQRLGQDQLDGDINGIFRYPFSLQREIEGSVSYINTRLAPPGKRVKIVLWSGEAVPRADALAMAQGIGLPNMNGGDTIISLHNPSLTYVSPMGRPTSTVFHVYAPIQNENIFTNLWTGPFYGFRDVISTFKLTEGPRRLKPMNIYYHFYSGTKIGALRALKEVYDWALAQHPLPIYGSEYAYKVQDFQGMTLARRLDGSWQVHGSGALRTLRLDPQLGGPDLSCSEGVIGVWDVPQGRYVGLSAGRRRLLCLKEPAPASVP